MSWARDIMLCLWDIMPCAWDHNMSCIQDNSSVHKNLSHAHKMSFVAQEILCLANEIIIHAHEICCVHEILCHVHDLLFSFTQDIMFCIRDIIINAHDIFLAQYFYCFNFKKYVSLMYHCRYEPYMSSLLIFLYEYGILILYLNFKRLYSMSTRIFPDTCSSSLGKSLIIYWCVLRLRSWYMYKQFN